MVFSSLEFLFYFLPLALLAYGLAPKKLRNVTLLLASLIFYTWGGGVFVVLLLVSTVADYLFGLLGGRSRRVGSRRGVVTAITGSVIVNLSLLGYFKYANFAVAQINSLAAEMGWGEIAWTSVVLPIGISFFTFQSMSYTIDVARGRAPRLKNPIDFAVYVTLFPQLIAGPIVRYREVASQITDRRTTLNDFAEGTVRFVHGLAKKVIVADAAGAIAEAAFAVPPTQLTSGTAWLGVFAYSIQIYFDFSGYSDMAIGLGRVFGFRFPENFNRPYSAVSITDFWRRWHMTLSNWFRDFVFIPMGGSRVSTTRMYANLGFVFLVCGFWHGANWTFIIWGAYHGALLILERRTRQRSLGSVNQEPARRALTFFLVLMGWVLFRADSLGHAIDIFGAMFAFGFNGLAPEVAVALTTRNAVILTLSALVLVLPRSFSGSSLVTTGSGPVPSLARAILLLLAPFYIALLVASGSFSPFIYFQF
jgi:alginate O-acetyltransferase complex protein AlgI